MSAIVVSHRHDAQLDDDPGRGNGAVLTVSPVVAPFLAVGITATVAGGLIAAASRPAGWDRGPWVAAFLVLVVGIGQGGLAIGQAAFGLTPTRRVVVYELLSINLGAALVIGGTLLSSPLTATVGSLLFGAALVLVARGAMRSIPGFSPGLSGRMFVALLAVLVVSVPVGVCLTWLRH